MDVNNKYKYTDDGQLLVRKTVSEPALPGSYPTERKMWFPCSGENPDHHYGIMVLTGWFGAVLPADLRLFWRLLAV